MGRLVQVLVKFAPGLKLYAAYASNNTEALYDLQKVGPPPPPPLSCSLPPPPPPPPPPPLNPLHPPTQTPYTQQERVRTTSTSSI